MANEIEMSARLYASKNGASINSQTFTTTSNMTGTDMGQNTQDIGSAADELLEIAADLSLPYKVLIKNLDLQYVYHEHVHVIGLAIIGVFCISVLFICICKKNSLLIYIQRKSEERENARRRSQNYRANRIMLNKVSQQASNL